MEHPPHFSIFDPASLWLLLAYSGAILLASIVGGWLPTIIHFTHTRIQIVISFVGGLMLGIAIFHLLPHAAVELGPARFDEVAWSLMIGLLAMFFLLRAFHFHQHGPSDFAPDQDQKNVCGGHHDHADHHHQGAQLHAISLTPTKSPNQATPPSATPDHHHHHDAHSNPGSKLRWMGVLVGLGFHTLLDGVAVGAAVQADISGSEDFALWGFGVFLAVFCHKPLDAISISSLMQAQGQSASTRFLVNLGFALMAPLGILLVVLGVMGIGESGQSWVGWGLGFSAGVFLCIALSDLLPEMEFHSHNRIQLTLALLFGIAAALGVGFLEPAGHHGHSHSTQIELPH